MITSSGQVRDDREITHSKRKMQGLFGPPHADTFRSPEIRLIIGIIVVVARFLVLEEITEAQMPGYHGKQGNPQASRMP
jgi:hypothetical protein